MCIIGMTRVALLHLSAQGLTVPRSCPPIEIILSQVSQACPHCRETLQPEQAPPPQIWESRGNRGDSPGELGDEEGAAGILQLPLPAEPGPSCWCLLPVRASEPCSVFSQPSRA